MRENNASAKADLGKENKRINPSTMRKENSKSYINSSDIQKISEYQNTGLPSKTVEPAPGY